MTIKAITIWQPWAWLCIHPPALGYDASATRTQPLAARCRRRGGRRTREGTATRMLYQVEIVCPKCGYRFMVEIQEGQVEQGTCPDCGTFAFR